MTSDLDLDNLDSDLNLDWFGLGHGVFWIRTWIGLDFDLVFLLGLTMGLCNLDSVDPEGLLTFDRLF